MISELIKSPLIPRLCIRTKPVIVIVIVIFGFLMFSCASLVRFSWAQI